MIVVVTRKTEIAGTQQEYANNWFRIKIIVVWCLVCGSGLDLEENQIKKERRVGKSREGKIKKKHG